MKSVATTAVPALEAESLFLKSNALLKGHFRLSSGLHSDQYFQCARLLEDARYGAAVARAVADLCRDLRPDVVLSPALGALLFGYELSRELGCRNIFAERQPGGPFELRRGFSLRPGERVLLAENVVTTGGSVVETAEMAKALGGEVIGFALIVDRSCGKFAPVEPVLAYGALEACTYTPEECPLCKQGLEIDKPGSRVFEKKG